MITTSLGRTHATRITTKVMQRGYDGAKVDRLVEDWSASVTTGDSEMQGRLAIIRGRARELSRNDPYCVKYLSALADNVYDHHGMTLQARSGDWLRDPKTGKAVFKLDDTACRMIEMAYAEWRLNPTVTGNMDANEMGRLALQSVARDGDQINRFVIDPGVNKFGFAVQMFEGDLIDENKNESAVGRNQIRMGVEVTLSSAPSAYWMLKSYPGDYLWKGSDGLSSRREEAANFLHCFKRERITQVRAVTWFAAIMRDMKMLNGFDESAITAARVGASKMGFFVQKVQDGRPYAGETDDAGNTIMDAAPGALEQLPYGTEFQSADWQYPDSAYAPFVLQRLRRISSGLNMSYNTLANDLTSVNFSSIRAGLMDEREHWKALQSWWIARFERPIFLKWLEVQLLNQNLNLPFSKFAKFATADFRPRRWAWVDPMRDVQANLAAIAGGLKSRNEIITETSDRDFTETADELAKEKEYAAQVGIELPAVNAVGAGSVSGGLDTTEDSDNPDADQMAAGAETIQLSALNGAQVQALTQLIAAVSQGQIPVETAKATIAAAFPLMTEQQISAMMKPLAGFKPKSQPESSPRVDTAK